MILEKKYFYIKYITVDYKRTQNINCFYLIIINYFNFNDNKFI